MSARDVESSVLFSFSTADLVVSYPIQKKPPRLKWESVNSTIIDSIHVWVTDGRGNLLNLNNIDLALSMFIQEYK